MGFFDIFKKKEVKEEKPREDGSIINQKNNVNNNIFSITKTDEGLTQIDYITEKRNPNTNCDTTRLIIKKYEGDLVRCDVSWYSQDDAIRFDPATGKEMGRRVNYAEILTEINFNLFMNDPNYAYSLMCRLLDKKRVLDDYLQRAYQENPINPCGKYIGEIIIKNNQYIKNFDPSRGIRAHAEMEQERRKYIEIQKEREKVQNNINNLKAEIKHQEEKLDRLRD